jgi:hypothetical protein
MPRDVAFCVDDHGIVDGITLEEVPRVFFHHVDTHRYKLNFRGVELGIEAIECRQRQPAGAAP